MTNRLLTDALATHGLLTTPSTADAAALAAAGIAAEGDTIARGLALKARTVVAQSAVPVVLTGTTSATVLATIPIPGNTMGANGALRITVYYSMTNNANTKTFIGRFGGAATQFFSAGLVSVPAVGFEAMIHNRGATGSQIMNGTGTASSFGTLTTMNLSSEDTTALQNIQLIGILTNVADTLTLERYTVEVLR